MVKAKKTKNCEKLGQNNEKDSTSGLDSDFNSDDSSMDEKAKSKVKDPVTDPSMVKSKVDHGDNQQYAFKR